jgi:hypothetical protein
MEGARQPAVLVEGTLAEHRVELSVLTGSISLGERGGEALALDRELLVAVEGPWRGDADEVVDGRDDVDRVHVLRPHDGVGRHLGRPRHQAHVGDAAFVAGPPLPVGERGVERPRPPGVVVVVRQGPAELVDVLQGELGGGWDAVEEPPLVEGAVGAAFTARAVVGHHDNDGVVELPGRLEEVDDPPDLVVGVLDVAGEHLGHPDEQSLLVVAQRLPGAHRVEYRPGLAFGAGGTRLTVRVEAAQLGVVGQQPELLLPGRIRSRIAS